MQRCSIALGQRRTGALVHSAAWEYMIEEGGIEALANYPYRARKFECQADSEMYECTITGCVGGPHTICENSGLNGDEEEFKKMLNDQPLAVAVDASLFQFYSTGILDCKNY